MPHQQKKNPLSEAASKLGKKGGKIGGPARAKALTPQRRKQIATQGGQARKRKAGKSSSRRSGKL